MSNEEITHDDVKEDEETKVKQPRRIIRRRPGAAPAVVDPVLLEKIVKASHLPPAYCFEIEKCVARISKLQATHVALQMPEGLLMYATVLADILQRLCATLQQVVVLGDVTFGACCVDDLGARALGCQLLIHYGHSCLVPLQHTVVPCLYVFVEIQIDVPHVVDSVQATLQHQRKSSGDSWTKPHVYLLGTVQFRHALVDVQQRLRELDCCRDVGIPQAKPLSPGEVLGCTSPTLKAHDDATPSVVVFVADGRFHLEATLISNAHVDVFYRYDPYAKCMTEERYDHTQMHALRQAAIAQARQATTFGIILGTLGRQGNPAIVQNLQSLLRQHGKKSFILLLSEITPAKLACFGRKVDAWVQVACPRLSVDWGHALGAQAPVLTPYELHVCLGATTWQQSYPMDYYSLAGGPWSNNHVENKHRQMILERKDDDAALA